MGKRMNGGRVWRINVWITAFLLLGVLVQGNRLAKEHLAFKWDLTEDQLFAESEVGARMLGGLEDLLLVKAFLTGNVKSGAAQIAKGRLIDQLEAYSRLAGGRMELSFVDPNESSEARNEAEALGLFPRVLRSMQGTSVVTQNLWLGLVLRYRGGEHVLPFVQPQTLEYHFLSGLRKLTRGRKRTVGFVTGDGRSVSEEFGRMGVLLADQYHLREVLDLARGPSVPEDVDVLVVARPTELEPRIVFAIDQFLQRGGRALILVDRVRVVLTEGLSFPVRTGLEELLATWGIAIPKSVVWDRDRCNRITVQLPSSQEKKSLEYPFYPAVGIEGLNREIPVTAHIPGAHFYWAQEITSTTGVGESGVMGLERRDMVWTSENSWSIDHADRAIVDPFEMVERDKRLDPAQAGSRVLAVSLTGRFPSAFAQGAPAPVDAIEAALREQRAQQAREEGRPVPVHAVERTEEVVLSRAADTQVVVIGDADWASTDRYFQPENQFFFVNLIDWLAVEEDLLALRSRIPTERKIVDLLQEERAKLGLGGRPEDVDESESRTLARFETQAAERAARRRWFAMLQATGGSLLAALFFGFLWTKSFGRSAFHAADPTDPDEVEA